MKLRVAFLLLPLFLLSCSKKPSEAERRVACPPSSAIPFQITVVETPEAKEIHDITNQVVTLLAAKDYDKLDDLAAKYRASKESYANGVWKLMVAYDAIAAENDLPSREAWASRQTEIQEWVKAKPESATVRIAMAKFLRNYAWEARGHDWASKVSDASWKLFGDRLNQG